MKPMKKVRFKSFPLFLLGDEKIVDMLVKNGATVDLRDGRGYTPLYYAVKHGNELCD